MCLVHLSSAPMDGSYFSGLLMVRPFTTLFFPLLFRIYDCWQHKILAEILKLDLAFDSIWFIMYYNPGSLSMWKIIKRNIQGCKKFPATLYSSPSPFFFNLDFLPRNFQPLLLSPLDILSNSLNIIRKMIFLPRSLFSRYIFPHSHDIPFPSSQLYILPNRLDKEIRNFIHPWNYI